MHFFTSHRVRVTPSVVSAPLDLNQTFEPSTKDQHLD